MKICGCINCKINGERNLYEEFELYYSTRQLETDAVFENIFKESYTIGEMTELYDELEPEFTGKKSTTVAARINLYGLSKNTWSSYEYLKGKYGNFTSGPEKIDS